MPFNEILREFLTVRNTRPVHLVGVSSDELLGEFLSLRNHSPGHLVGISLYNDSSFFSFAPLSTFMF